jgi:hypothetical protein
MALSSAGYRQRVSPDGNTANPVLHYLAIARAARDFGLETDELDRLAQDFPPTDGRVASFADAVADALLGND